MLSRLASARPRVLALVLLLWTGLVSAVAWRFSFAEVAWPDECIYLVGARNVVERGTLQTQFYLTHSLLQRGHPHRDVHMPGSVLVLAPFVAAFGPQLKAAVVLNVLSLAACTVLLLAIGRRLLPSATAAFAAAAILPVLPPFPGYIAVAYPELVVTVVLLAGLAWLARGTGTATHAAVAGALFIAGGLFRETLWIALPVYLLALPRRLVWRAFLPAAAATFLLVVMPLSKDRAIHPNALYPSVFMEAQRSADPVGTLTGVLRRNVATNLRLALESSPFERAEDAVLVFLLGLALASALAWPALTANARRWAMGTWVSLGLLTVAVFVLYVVRERGGVWGGVRAYMTWAPLLLLFVSARAAAMRRQAGWAVLAAGLVLAVALDRWQIYWFGRYKGSDYEDQDRNARYLESHIRPAAPRRIVSRSFLYGYRHYPTEVVWGLPQDLAELRKLEDAIDYEYLAFHEKHPIRLHLIQNPRYKRVNKDDRGAEFLIWRRMY